MRYSNSIKAGFNLINSKWQLVVVQVCMMLFNCIGFFIMVGIPLGIAFIIFGLDLTGLSEIKDILPILKNPAGMLSKYFGLILIVLTSFLLYIALATTVGLFVFSGSVGMIGRTFLESSLKFSTRAFFSEARKLFFPLMWFSLAAGLIFVIIAFIIGLFGGGAAAIVSGAKAQDSTLALFLGIFFSLVLVLIGFSLILSMLAVTVYGIAALFFRGEGAVKSLAAALRFLWDRQDAFWLYVILFFGYIVASFAMMLVVYPFNLIPIIGTIIAFPFQMLSYAIQGYMGLVIIAIIFHYYHESEIRVADAPQTGPAETPTGGDSTQVEDISAPQAPVQEPLQPETDNKDQV